MPCLRSRFIIRGPAARQVDVIVFSLVWIFLSVLGTDLRTGFLPLFLPSAYPVRSQKKERKKETKKGRKEGRILTAVGCAEYVSTIFRAPTPPRRHRGPLGSAIESDRVDATELSAEKIDSTDLLSARNYHRMRNSSAQCCWDDLARPPKRIKKKAASTHECKATLLHNVHGTNFKV